MLTGTCHCGATGWTFDGIPDSATACNCGLCHRYGALWIYDYEDGRIALTGPTQVYTRADRRNPALEFHFCPRCACVVCWRAIAPGEAGRRRMAVNIRLTGPGPLSGLPIDHFDGLDSFDDLPRDGRTVRDMWF